MGGDVRGDQGNPHGAGLDGGQVEAFGRRGRDHGAGSPHQGRQGAVGQVLGLMDQALQIGRALQQIEHRFILPAVASDQDQTRGLGAHPFLQATPHRQQEGEILAGLDGADMDEIGMGGSDHDAAVQGALEAQVGDIDRGRRQAGSSSEGQKLISRVLGVDDDP
ncbi:hypothetical protein D3C73_1268680 [compost metagenome]